MATCSRCGYQWQPRKAFPVACPNQLCQAPWPLGKDPARFGPTPWMRQDKSTGAQEGATENEVRRAAEGRFRDVGMALASGRVETPYAIYWKK